jgi:hypothetical protein
MNKEEDNHHGLDSNLVADGTVAIQAKLRDVMSLELLGDVMKRLEVKRTQYLSEDPSALLFRFEGILAVKEEERVNGPCYFLVVGLGGSDDMHLALPINADGKVTEIKQITGEYDAVASTVSSDELTHEERVHLGCRIYGLYTLGSPPPWSPTCGYSYEFALKNHRIDEACAMDNMRVPRYRSECNEHELEVLKEMKNGQ